MANRGGGSLFSPLRRFLKNVQRAADERQRAADRHLRAQPWANDPLAPRTEWDPASPGGASFCTRRLYGERDGRLIFAATPGACAFGGVFLVLGLLFVVLPFVTPVRANGHVPTGAYVGSGVGGLFALVGFGILYALSRTPVFDRHQGWFYVGSKPPLQPGERAVRLTEIRALQLVAERCESDDGSYLSYELNLVLHDGRRLNVVDHGNYERLSEDAATLARFLSVPVWDACEAPGWHP